ncbi:hypothetical protein [Thermococcus sp. AM4]|uniref:hypothetical protein n=1 Tax=Thermococcus sp. (strain AM4) TaxID=246969 RepID=UPI0001870F5A|nr:hypothetical protein [Thermococcus sp. AM4]EEB73793.1 hypothetical protein TAM4_81 [Thermococcus sp. AM4]
MRWWKTIAIIAALSLLLSASVTVLGISYWSPLESSMHAEIRLDQADQLLKFGKAVDKNVTYSFDVFWPMKAGKTELSLNLANVDCPKNADYTIKVVTMDGKVFQGSGPVRFEFERRDPFLYIHVSVDIPNSCRVLPSRNGPEVVVNVSVG